MNIKQLSLISFSLIMVGCAQSNKPTQVEALQPPTVVTPSYTFMNYKCDDAKSLDIAYLNDGKAVLKLVDSEHRLKEVPAASGIQYILDDNNPANDTQVVLWAKGKMATAEINGVAYRTCQINK